MGYNKRIIRQRRKVFNNYERLSCALKQLHQLISQVVEKDIPDTIIEEISQIVRDIDRTGSFKKRALSAEYAYSEIVRLLHRKLNIVMKNYYLYLWLVIGLPLFVLPLVRLLPIITGDFDTAFFGYPIGILMSLTVGALREQKAERENRQLDI